MMPRLAGLLLIAAVLTQPVAAQQGRTDIEDLRPEGMRYPDNMSFEELPIGPVPTELQGIEPENAQSISEQIFGDHLVGSRPFYTGDRSTNNAWLALPTLGGSWHNNHHAFPTTASNQLLWWQLDPCYWVIAALARLGAVTDVKLPSADAIRAKRAAAARRTSLPKDPS